jgi:ABC-type uncharacterized transport system substrate-binding protein
VRRAFTFWPHYAIIAAQDSHEGIGMRLRLVTAAGALLATTVAAFAHPHVLTDMRTSLMVDNTGLITGIRAEWTFDESYSNFALEGLDADGDGVYGPEEIKPLTIENIKNLEESDFFGFMRLDGKRLPHGEVTDYVQTYNNNRLTLYFVLPLQTPVDPRRGAFNFKIYDPDFFIDFTYVKDDPVALEGTLPAGCSWELQPLLTDEELEQKRNFLAEKSVDWQNDTGEDFGSVFARPVAVTCKP